MDCKNDTIATVEGKSWGMSRNTSRESGLSQSRALEVRIDDYLDPYRFKRRAHMYK